MTRYFGYQVVMHAPFFEIFLQLDEEKKLQTQLTETEQRIERYQMMEKESKEKEAMDVDDLDDFMSGLSSEKKMDKAEVRKCRVSLIDDLKL